VSNALVAAGGVSRLGSLRRVQLRRGNSLVKVIDLYDMLLYGRTADDEQLSPQDVIFIPVIGPVTGVAGNVKRPAIYELAKSQDSLKTILDIAGGITAFGYAQRIQVERIENHTQRIALDIRASQLGSQQFTVRDGDLVKVFPVLPGQTNIVMLDGNVLRPGPYQWYRSMRLSDLIREGEGLAPHTFFKYALIKRIEGPTRATHVVPVELGAALAGGRNRSADPLLKPMDTVRIFNENDMRDRPKVAISGAVRIPGEYMFEPGMRVSDLVYLAGGLKQDSYQGLAELSHTDVVDGKEILHTHTDLDLNAALRGSRSSDLALEPGDTLFIRGIIDRNPLGDVVTVRGEVGKPGSFPWSPGMKLTDLIYLAGGLKNAAYQESAELAHTKVIGGKEITHPYTSVNLKAALDDPGLNDVELEPGDSLFVRGIIDRNPPVGTVSIRGQVSKPGSYTWSPGMKLSDLIYLAGGLNQAAYMTNAELARTEVLHGSHTVHRTISVNLLSVLSRQAPDPRLQANDELLVLQVPGYHLPWLITVQGQVWKPGPYVIHQGERLSSLLVRCGGLLPDAYIPGTIFIRESIKSLEAQRLKESRARLEQKVAELRMNAQNFGAVPEQEGQSVNGQGQARETLEYLKRVLEETQSLQAQGRMVLHLSSIYDLQHSADDVELENEDLLTIPRRPSSVSVLGQVYNPTAIVYKRSLTVRDYLEQAGGISEGADGDHMYIVKADGAIVTEQGMKQSEENRWFPLLPVITGGLMAMHLEPGDTVYVPEKLKFTNNLQIAKDVATIIGQSITSLGIIALLVK
jgi:protein involved in polysaccharide export with SLBB domain